MITNPNAIAIAASLAAAKGQRLPDFARSIGWETRKLTLFLAALRRQGCAIPEFPKGRKPAVDVAATNQAIAEALGKAAKGGQ